MGRSSISFTAGEIAAYYEVRVPNLKEARGGERRGPCPVHGGHDDNFAVNTETGEAYCHSHCGRGWDLIGIERELTGADFRTSKAEVSRLVGRINGVPNHPQTKGKSAGTVPTKPVGKRREIERYQYVDASGVLLYEVIRYLKADGKKDFGQCRPSGVEAARTERIPVGAAVHGLAEGLYVRESARKLDWCRVEPGSTPAGSVSLRECPLVPYRLPNLIARESEIVFIAEGEKDVHSLELLGLLATCNAMGAGKWRPEYSEALRGRTVVIFPDNDERGRRHALSVAADLLRAGCTVRIAEVPAGKDVTDWITAGATIEQIQDLAKAQPALTSDTLARLKTRWDEEAIAAPGSNSHSPETNSPFELTKNGVVYREADREPLLICGRLEVAALTCNASRENWGRLLRWYDADERKHEWAMPMSLLAGDGNEYRARLLDGGLFIAPDRRARGLMTVYLQSMRPNERVLCVSRVGWHGDTFVLPGATIGPDNGRAVIYQTPFETEHHLIARGTADEWRDHIGRFCSGNSRLILAVSCAFAGTLLSLVGGESGGFHLVGTTSTGKSTALLVGGSVLGGGGQNGFVQSWRSTANGLEAIAELHNNLTLFLDELAQVDPKEAADTAYLLGNGYGKTRMSRTQGARKKLSWSLLYVSAGEVTLADHALTAGKRTKGGGEVRLLNIDADAGVGLGLFEQIHGAESPDAFARQLKEAARRYYGAPLLDFLGYVVRNRADAEKWVRNYQDDFVAAHVRAGALGDEYRAAQRCGLIAAAGELATDAGLTDWQKNEAQDAAKRCFENWMTQRGSNGADVEAAFRQVKRFLEANGASRFQSKKARLDGQGKPIQEKVVNRAGFLSESAGERTELGDSEESGEAKGAKTTTYLILPEVFRAEVCEGFDHRMVAKALNDAGFLESEPGRLNKKCRLPEVGSVRVYAVKASLLNH